MTLDLLNTPDDITKRHEDQLHTYTPLFSPPTPRASPSPGEQAKEESRRRRSYRANYGDALGIGGGSGIGVMVPDMQDPLSVPVPFTHGGEHGEKNHGNTDTDTDSMGATGNANSTLAFFDKFVSEARAASEMKRRSVLDEILLHQDDPLFRWSRSALDDQVRAASGDEVQPQEEIQNTEITDELGPCLVPERLEAGERVESPTHTPKRSPTLSSLQPTLAPPLESTDTANAATNTAHPPLSFPDSSTRSPYVTLSGLHSRWVSSRLHNNDTGNTSILSSSSPTSTHMPFDLTSAPSTTSTSTTKPLTPRTIPRPQTSTNPNPNTNTKARAHVRSSSFGSSSSHSPSPFASHMFVPISGAPGFVDERYNWDRGFSDELIKELEDVDHTNPVEEWRVLKTESDKDKGDTADTRRVMKPKFTRETRGTTEAKENVANGTTRILGKTQLTQTLIAGSGVSRISKKDKDKDKDKDSVMKRVRGFSSTVASGPSGSLGGGPLSVKNHEKVWSETLERGKGNGTSNEERHYDGRLVSELIEKKLGSVELKGRKEITAPVLDVPLADSLRTHLPALDRLPKTWNLVYSLDQHGISLNTLYTRCEAHTQAQAQSQARLGGSGGSRMIGSGAGIGRPGMIVVVKDSGDSVFGVWIGDGLRQSRGKGYYGSGESFMWRYRNVEQDLDVYKWTGKNKYVVLGEPDYISFGGGEGKYGLYLDETLFEGSSSRCPTFDNEPLCSPGANKAGAVAFECVGLEVWGIGP